MSGPIFTYSPNIPQANQYIRPTQQPILSNFSSIQELFMVNHVGPEDPTYFGKHTFTSLPSQGSIPTTALDEMALFCSTASGSNPYELFYRYPNNGTVAQLTGVNSFGSDATTGYSILTANVPGFGTPMIVKWGLVSGLIGGTANNVITFPTGGSIPAFTQTPSVNWVFSSSSVPVPVTSWITSILPASFTWITTNTAGPTFSIYYFAIGI